MANRLSNAAVLLAVSALTMATGCSETMLSAHHTNPVDNSFWFSEVSNRFGVGGEATLWYCRLDGAEQNPVCKRATLMECKGTCSIKANSMSANFNDEVSIASDHAAGAGAPGAAEPSKSSEQGAADKSKVGF